ncbi:hypothetical protein SCG7109_AJ_00120 [Chlamydiales bacterium SCGC AG-110-M15]|nr:hypothetical protein SCG7109_AJ_00120 [Chlamydiales bacterium SCGC AG-110-M15]
MVTLNCKNSKKEGVKEALMTFLQKSNGVQNDTLVDFGRKNHQAIKTFLLGLENIFDERIIETIPHLIRGISLEDFSLSFQLCKQLLTSKDEYLERAALVSLGLLNYKDGSERELSEVLKLLAQYKKEERKEVLSVLTFSYGNLIEHTDAAFEFFLLLARKNIPEVRFQVLCSLSLHEERYHSEEWYRDLLLDFTNLSIHYRGLIEQLDLLLAPLVADEERLVFEFLELWIANASEKEICRYGFLEELFPHTLYRIKERSPKVLEKIIVKWFVQEKMPFQFAAGSLAKCYCSTSLGLEQTELQRLSVKELVFLIRKIIGHVFLCDALCSLLFSILESRSQDIRVIEELEQAFAYVVYNYPHVLKVFLAEKQNHSEKEVSQAVRNIIEGNQSYFDHISSLPFPKELEGDPLRVEKLLKENHRLFVQAFDNGKNHLKYGRSSFPSTPLQSDTLPRGEYLDPIGQEMLRFGYRVESKGDIQ